ncbi:MAG: protein kinase [Deltaproteobacteria bacterium]|nr:protein kinase [Deltaproteobacteria bacterium]
MQSDNINHSSADGLSEIQEKIHEAELYLSQGLFDEARQVYQQLLEELGSLSQKASTDPAFRQTYESRRGFIREQLALIERQEAEFHGQPSEAKPEEHIDAQEGEGSAAFNRGQAFLDIGLYAEAIQEFQSAASLGFQPIECSLQIGKAHIQLGQHREGLRILEKTYRQKGLDDTDRNVLLGQMAVGYETAGDMEKALEFYQQLAASDPTHRTAAKKVKSLAKDSDRYELNVVKLHLKNEQFSKAIKTLRHMESEQQVPVDRLVPLYEQVLEKDPGNADAMERVAAIYQEMLDNGSEKTDIRLKLARHLLRAGEFDSAANEYLHVMLEDTPYKLTALTEFGEALLKRQDYDRTLEVLEDALPWIESIKPGPETLKYYYLMGTACERKNLYDRAQTYFQRAASIDPTHKVIRSKVQTQTQGPLLSTGKGLLGLQVDPNLKYEIQAELGQDEIHQIVRVREVPSGTFRVAKTLLPQLSGGAKVKDFIVKWAYEQLNMENRNITRVLDVAEHEGHYYLIMENFDSTLEDLLKEKPHLSIAEALSLARALLNALAYAHSHRGADDTLRKIFHLALNSKRVIVSDQVSNAKITDFGLVYQLSNMLDLTTNYEKLSAFELAYMAPELFNRAPARMPDKMKQAADLYSFGLVFYQALTGKLPFEGPSPEDFKKQHNEKYPVPPRVHISSIPAKLDEAILKCLHKDPKKRWRTPTELDLALEKIPTK